MSACSTRGKKTFIVFLSVLHSYLYIDLSMRKALKWMKRGKAAGPVDTHVEVWKCLGEWGSSVFEKVVQEDLDQ